jgi:hypothetical protein
MVKNRMLKEKSGPKVRGVTGEQRKSYNEVHNLYLLPNVFR